jgi:hypothetical protein
MVLKERGRKGVDWLKLIQNRDSWSAVVNAITSTGVP